jgi:serine/threonine protein phosphatase PrpC
MSLEMGSDNHISFAKVNLVGKSNEDASWNDINPSSQARASFAVYDGHAGKYAANYLAKSMYPKINKKFAKLSGEIEERMADPSRAHWKLMSEKDRMDAAICKATHEAIHDCDTHIRSRKQ